MSIGSEDILREALMLPSHGGTLARTYRRSVAAWLQVAPVACARGGCFPSPPALSRRSVESYADAISTPERTAVRCDDLQRLLIEHTEAWNSHDLDRLMSLFADDCVFEASGGPEFCGRRFRGREDVRSAFAGVLDSMPDANWGDGRHFGISENYGVSEWRLTGTLLDGTRLDVLGCDFITVHEGRIVRKNSFRKQRPPVVS